MDSLQNDRLARVGPGTPGGNLLRRYWQPLCPESEITPDRPKKRIRIMGENLVVFRDQQGRLGCVEEFCKHRGASLYHGFIEDRGLRCCYHGWLYDAKGQCLEQPFEPAQSNFKGEIKLRAYPVQRLGGLLFVYMGPHPDKAPLLPRWDVLVREDGTREVRVHPMHACNWLQIQENTADSTHTYFLHARMNEVLKLGHPLAPYYARPVEHYEFTYCEWGIDKTVVYGGEFPETEIRPPLIFPNILRIPTGAIETIHWRVPVDDENTRILIVAFTPSEDPAVRSPDGDPVPCVYYPEWRGPDGEYDLRTFPAQDQMAVETQGSLYDRTRENLGVSDRGIILFRRMLSEQIAKVENGEDPTVAVVRDAQRNRIIDFPNQTSPVKMMEQLAQTEKS